MSRIMCLATPKVKAARKTPRPDRPFGQGILRFVPFAVTAPGFIEPSDEDRAWAAYHLNADSADVGFPADAELEFRAGESAGYDAITAGVFV